MSKPLTVFVVDDEQIVRDYFAEGFPWHQIDMQWIGDAGDGETALERCRQLHPDLILLDITMPGMDGLEVLSCLSKDVPYANCILLTCHQEFEYAQRALRLGAVDYLVKAATTPDELLDKLTQARQRIEWKRSQARLSTLQRQWLAQVLLTGMPSLSKLNTERRRLRLPLMNAPCVTMLIHVREGEVASEQPKESADLALSLRIQEVLDAACTELESALWAVPHLDQQAKDRYALVANVDPATAISTMQDILRRVRATLHPRYTVDAGLSQIHPDLGNLDTALREAEHALSARFYFEEDLLLPRAVWCELEPDVLADFERLAVCPLTGQGSLLEQLDSLVVAAITRCRQQCVNPEIARMLILHLIQKQVERLGGEVSRWELAVWPIQVAKLATASRLRMWASQIASTLMVASGRLGLRPEIQRVIDDLHGHLAEPYDLGRAAAVAGLHPNYFSAVFRSETGQTFSEYVGRLRMERAARYLQEGVWGMQQIADMVGIGNYRTFYNTFCRFMGASPTEFAASVKRTGV